MNLDQGFQVPAPAKPATPPSPLTTMFRTQLARSSYTPPKTAQELRFGAARGSHGSSASAGVSGVTGPSASQQYLSSFPSNDGGHYVSPDMLSGEGASNTYANIVKAQNEDYKQRYLPHELDLYKSLGDAQMMRDQVDRSGNLAGAGADLGKASAERQLQKFGTTLNPMQRDEFERRYNSNKALAVNEARNAARLAKKERDMQVMAGQVGNYSSAKSMPDGG